MIRDFILRSFCHSKEESIPERLLYFFKMFVLFSQQYQTTNRMKKFPSIGIFRNQNSRSWAIEYSLIYGNKDTFWRPVVNLEALFLCIQVCFQILRKEVMLWACGENLFCIFCGHSILCNFMSSDKNFFSNIFRICRNNLWLPVTYFSRGSSKIPFVLHSSNCSWRYTTR